MLLLFLACFRSSPSDTPSQTDTVVDSNSTPQDTSPAPVEDTGESEPQLILMITLDAMTRYYYGWYPDPSIPSFDNPGTTITPYDWDVTPFTDTLVKEGALMPDVQMSRALTGVSLATVFTGNYPPVHGIRDNTDEVIQARTLPQQLSDAGWTTVSILANRCLLGQEEYTPGWDHTECVYEDAMTEEEYPFSCPESFEDGDDDDFDEKQAQQCAEDYIMGRFQDIIDQYATEKLFLWVHLINPHDELETVEPWFSEFHPGPYRGDFRPFYRGSLDQVTLGLNGIDDDKDGEIDEADERVVYTDADRRFVDAVYASSIRANDQRLAQMVEFLQERDLYDDAVLVLGADHGDELAFRPKNPYFWHGCTYYGVASMASWFFKGPGIASGVIPGVQGAVDLAPTLLDLAGVSADGMDMYGTSLLPNLSDLSDPGRAHFVERGIRAAGVVEGNYKYVMNPDGAFFQCNPFSSTFQYVTPTIELYDLNRDPTESENLYSREPEIANRLRGSLCAYILDGTWSNDTDNPLVSSCELNPGGS